MIAFSIPPLTIEILDGDIAGERTDAIVNAANNQFWMGAGVAGALKRRGGLGIEAEAMAQGPVDPGGCVVTSAGQLAARYVVHAAVMGQDLQTSGEVIAKATTNALFAGDRRGCVSMAFPAFGTGVGGFPLDECARIMTGAVRSAASGCASVRLIRFVLFGQSAYERFSIGAGAVLGPAGGGGGKPPEGP